MDTETLSAARRARWRRLALVALLLCAAAQAPAADDPAARGTAIAEAAQRRGAGFGDMQAEAEMRIRNARGAEALRALSIRILDLPGDASRSLTVVNAPKDVKGTALLTHTLETGDSEQWLYLPALARVKRIASSGRSGPFMGSEFSFEDFSAQIPGKYHFRWLRDEALDGVDCHVLDRRPRDPADSSYARQTIWLDREHLRLHRVEFYDRQDHLIKTLTAHDFQLHDGRHWRASRLLMKNARTQAETALSWRQIRFGSGLSERDFDVNSLAATR